MPMQEGGEDETSAPFAESRPEDGSRHRQKYCPGSGLREMEERRRPIRVKLSHTRQPGRGLHALMGKPVC